MIGSKNLECSRVLHFFEQISRIPRASGNEKQISDFLVNFAEQRNLEAIQDDALNVVIKKAAARGYENSPTVVIQGHMDMVCVKKSDVIHNFDTDPIKLVYDEDFLRADGTTLGGDDGIAVAMAMALLDSQDIAHPPLEVLITTDEEVGMEGASAFDSSVLKGKRLLNIDSEAEGIFTAGCAGGIKTTTEFKTNRKKVQEDLEFYKISVGGLRGGHSGIDIHKERGNAIRLIARTLMGLRNKVDISVADLWGGAKDNAIAGEAYAVIGIKGESYFKFKNFVDEFSAVVSNELRNSDSQVFISAVDCKKAGGIFPEDTVDNVLKAILLIPNGVQSMSTDIENLPESSNNMGILRCQDNKIEIVCAVRSCVASKKYFILEQIKAVGELCGAETICKGDYPAWEFRKNSPLRDKMTEVYKRMFNTEAVIDIIHAGLECGIFAKKLPDMDMISFGPNIMDIHSPEERLSISSLERTWKFLIEVLKELKE